MSSWRMDSNSHIYLLSLGTSIAVYGTFDSTSGGVITTYSVDGGPGTNATAQAGLGDTIRQQFWRSGQFSLGEQ
jgi:hypothetical protein